MTGFFDEIDRSSMALKVVDKFKEALANGTLKTGDRLPPERELAAQMGISRAPLREGLSILSAYGILESKRGEGTYITDKFAEQVFDFLGIGNLDSKENFKNLMQLRKILEEGSVDFTIKNLTPEDIAEFESMLVEDVDQMESVKLDAKFHQKIIRMTGNPIIIEMYKMTFKMLTRLISRLIVHDDVQLTAYHDHEAIVQYLKEGDVPKCKQAIRSHLGNIENYIDKYF